MRGFRFRLDAVLKLRCRALDAARRQLSQAVLRVEQLGREAELASGRAGAAAAELQDRARAGVSAGEFTARRHALSRQVELRQVAEQALHSAREMTARSRETVVGAHTEVRALEVLRAKALDEYRRLQQLREQNEFDEIAGQRHSRQVQARLLARGGR